MAWIRKLRCVVQTPRQLVGGKWTWTETEVDALHMDATMTRSRRWCDNEMNLTIYNMNRDKSRSVFCRGATIMLYAGYENDGDGLMFQGNVISHFRRRVGTDSVDTVYAMCLRGIRDNTFGTTPISLAFGDGVRLSSIYERIAQALGLVLYGAENLKGITIPGGFYYAGSISEAIAALDGHLSRHGLGVARDLAAMVVYSLTGGDTKYAITYLSYDSGLLEIRDATDYAGQAKAKVTEVEEKAAIVISQDGSEDVLKEIESIYTDARKEIVAQTIVIPKLKPNALVDVRTDDISGQFVVDSMEIAVGNLPDSQFNMELRLIEVMPPTDTSEVQTYTVEG